VNEKEGQREIPKCPRCGATVNQLLRGFEEGWTKYRCEHCKEVYKIEGESK